MAAIEELLAEREKFNRRRDEGRLPVLGVDSVVALDELDGFRAQIEERESNLPKQMAEGGYVHLDWERILTFTIRHPELREAVEAFFVRLQTEPLTDGDWRHHGGAWNAKQRIPLASDVWATWTVVPRADAILVDEIEFRPPRTK